MITIQEIQNLPEITLEEQFKKFALLRAYLQVNDYDNYKSNTQYLLDKILQSSNLEQWQISEKYAKFVKKMKKEETHKELFEKASNVIDEKIEEEKKAKEEKIKLNLK